MKKFAIFSFIGLLTLSGNLTSALSPVYQSVKEYEALLDSDELIQALGQNEPITLIQREGNGFVVTSKTKSVHVNIIYDPQSMPGPRKFHFEFIQ